MTNAPVESQVAATNGATLTVTVKGEKNVVALTPETIVSLTGPGTPDMVIPGSKVLVFAQQAADGTLSAPRINVGANGFTPPN